MRISLVLSPFAVGCRVISTRVEQFSRMGAFLAGSQAFRGDVPMVSLALHVVVIAHLRS
jgi:hypothetical protein